MKEAVVDVKQLTTTVATTNHDLQSLITSLHERQRDDSTRFQTLETTMDAVLKSIQALVTGSRAVSHSPSFQVRNVKLDFPKFDGSEVLQWIFRAEQFFYYYNTPDEQRLLIASVHLEKEVVPWFQMQSHNQAFPS